MRKPWVFLAVAMIAVGCGTAPATPPTSPNAPRASLTPSRTDPVSPATTPAASLEPAIGIGSAVVTVSDALRVRSAPGVSDDSVKYKPLLPLGTELLVVGGPVEATGYVWWQVEPLSFALQDANVGWVAMADHDGEPWIALSGDSSPQLAMAISDVARMPVDKGQAKAVPIRSRPLASTSTDASSKTPTAGPATSSSPRRASPWRLEWLGRVLAARPPPRSTTSST